MRTLITGITGRVGRQLAQRLKSSGHEIRGLVLPSDLASGLADGLDAELVAGGLSDLDALAHSMEGMDAVIHLAGFMSWGDETRNRELFDVNLEGTVNLLEAVRMADGRIQRFVFASSDEVYPSLGGRYLPIDETHPTEPYSFYGATKLAGEHVVRYYGRAHGVPISIARFALVTAPKEVLEPTGWLGRFLYLDPMIGTIRARSGDAAADRVGALRQGDTTLLIAREEDGRPYTFHYVDVRDVVMGLELLLTKPEAVGEAFNLAGPAAFSFDHAASELSKGTGFPVVDAMIPGPGIQIEHSIAKARSLLGYVPRFGIDETIRDALLDQ